MFGTRPLSVPASVRRLIPVRRPLARLPRPAIAITPPAPPAEERREALYLSLLDLVADARAATFDAAAMFDRIRGLALATIPAA